jgi:DNA repair exonuclease SbcCD nuclease subunit
MVSLSPTRRLRVLHTADVHLDSDSYGGADQGKAHRERCRRCFRAIVDMASAEAVDLVLIAGDLFDHNRVADETVAFVQDELQRLRRPVIILPGNHDCLSPNAIYDRHDVTAGSEHVRVITEPDGQTIELPGLEVVIWGRAMQEHEPGFHPLAHLPSRDAARWHIAMAHGFFYPERQRPDRSSPIFGEEIRDTGWDYVALGHQHVPTDVSQGAVVARYAGAPIVDWRGEPGFGHVSVVELSPERGVTVRSQPISTARSGTSRP